MREQLPPAFLDYWTQLCERAPSLTCAHRILGHLYRAGETIPGYAVPERGTNPPLPRGWSLRNLQRYRPRRYRLSRTRLSDL